MITLQQFLAEGAVGRGEYATALMIQQHFQANSSLHPSIYRPPPGKAGALPTRLFAAWKSLQMTRDIHEFVRQHGTSTQIENNRHIDPGILDDGDVLEAYRMNGAVVWVRERECETFIVSQERAGRSFMYTEVAETDELLQFIKLMMQRGRKIRFDIPFKPGTDLCENYAGTLLNGYSEQGGGTWSHDPDSRWLPYLRTHGRGDHFYMPRGADRLLKLKTIDGELVLTHAR